MSEWSRRSFLRTSAVAGLAVLPGAGRLTGDRRRPAADTSGSPLGRNPDDPLGVRAKFPVTEELAYLNTASNGPISTVVRDAMTAYADEKMRQDNPTLRRAAEPEAREKYARLFGADEDEIAFLYSTSDGENAVANAIDWRRGDNVVVDELHFTTAFVLYRELERRHGIELRIVPARRGRAPVDDFAARTDARTRLISVAWVSNRNGYRHDLPALAEVAHASGGYLFADGIQALGTFPTNLHEEGVDFACGNGYKWLFADFGCAPFYVRREHLEWMQPDRSGHRQVAETLDGHRYRMRETAQKFQYANVAYGPIVAMNAALGFIEEVGLNPIALHTFSLAGELRDELVRLGVELFTPAENPSPIVSFYHGLDPQTLGDALTDAGVRFTFQEQGRLVRTAVAMFNNRDDVDRMLGVIASLV